MRKCYLVILTVLLLACQREETPRSPILVVEGWIESGGAPMVLLSESVPVQENQEIAPRQLLDNVAKWAKVTVSDGTRTEILTGMANPDYFPPYVFTSGTMKGEVGKTYTLTVEYKDYKATATTTIPAPVSIDRVFVRDVKDTLVTAVCAFTDPPASGNCYKVFTRTEDRDKHYHPSALAIATDENLDGYTEIFLFSTQRLMDYIFQSNIRQGDKLWIKLCTMDRKSYDYWSNFEATLTGNMINMPSARSVLDNMVQGASGYWIGYGVDTPKLLDTAKSGPVTP